MFDRNFISNLRGKEFPFGRESKDEVSLLEKFCGVSSLLGAFLFSLRGGIDFEVLTHVLSEIEVFVELMTNRAI
jgi:hypothetical protein